MPIAAAIAPLAGAAIGAIATRSAGKKAAEAQDRATAASTAVTDRQLALAEDQWNRYKETFGPLEDEFVQRARDYDSAGNREQAATEAAGDVASSYAGLRQRLASSPGLDPSSKAYLDALSRVGVQEAGASAAAQTAARRGVEARGTAMLGDAVSIGRGLPGNTSATLAGAGVAAAGLSRAADSQYARTAAEASSVGRMVGDVLSDRRVGEFVGGLFQQQPQAPVVVSPGNDWGGEMFRMPNGEVVG